MSGPHVPDPTHAHGMPGSHPIAYATLYVPWLYMSLCEEPKRPPGVNAPICSVSVRVCRVHAWRVCAAVSHVA